MRLRFLTYFFMLFLFFMRQLPAQEIQFIPLSVDYSCFKATDKDDYVEIYLSFYQKELRYVQTDSGYVAQYISQAYIYQQDSLINQISRTYHNVVPNLQAITNNRQFIDLFLFQLPPGKYAAKIVVDDLTSHGIGEYILDIDVPDFGNSKFSMSDLEICSQISKPVKKNIFIKNTLQVVPNPSCLFGIQLPVLYYYAELYNVPFSPDTPSTYTINAFITNKDGETIRTFPAKQETKPGNSFVVVGGYNIITLPPGTYFFHLKVTDNQTGQSLSRSRRFRLFKPTKKETVVSASTPKGAKDPLLRYYQSLSPGELDKEFAWSTYIASSEEKKVYSQLDTDGKRKFLYKFWKKRDTDPQTVQNEFRQEYLMLVNYANQKFGTIKKEGWKTDRGRILLQHGRPDEIERYPMRTGMKPYEIWHYLELEGGVIFVFADLNGFGDYQLVHSTYSKELQNPDWIRLVQRTPAGNNSEIDKLAPPQ